MRPCEMAGEPETSSSSASAELVDQLDSLGRRLEDVPGAGRTDEDFAVGSHGAGADDGADELGRLANLGAGFFVEHVHFAAVVAGIDPAIDHDRRALAIHAGGGHFSPVLVMSPEPVPSMATIAPIVELSVFSSAWVM